MGKLKDFDYDYDSDSEVDSKSSAKTNFILNKFK